MKTLTSTLLLCLFCTFSLVAQSVSETYNSGNIPTQGDSSPGSCVSTLTVPVPVGATVTTVDVVYNFEAVGDGYKSDQRSQIYCQQTTTDEGGYHNGTGDIIGTQPYNRTGLTIANGHISTGSLTFEMRAYRTYGGSGCNETYNFIPNNTWQITVHYTLPISGHLGPGGVGNTNGTDLTAWYLPKNIRNASNVLPTNGETINTWLDASGYNKTVTNTGSATYQSSVLNTNAVMEATSLLRQFQTSTTVEGKTLIAVNNPGTRNAFEGIVGLDWDKGIRRPETTDNTWHFPGGGDGVNNDSWCTDTGKSFINGSTTNTGTHNNQWHIINQERPTTHTGELFIGGYYSYNGDNRPFTGEIAEIIAYKANLNTAQRIIVDNYLSAKYNIPLVANDIYDEDNDIIDGNFDFDVAGIGQASDGSNHTDSQGTGIVRINTPSALANNDFLFWGRNNNSETYAFTTTADYKERMNTLWRVSKQNDLGTVTFQIDLTGISVATACSIQLVIDNNADFSSPTSTYNLTETAVGSNIYEATLVNFNDNDYFTIQYVDKIVVDASGFYNGSGATGKPNMSDTCYELLVKADATGTTTATTLTIDAHVDRVTVEAGGKLVVATDRHLRVTNGIELDGEIRLIGTSQLLQTHAGTSLNTNTSGAGKLFMDQATASNSATGGTPNFKSLYWSSPVSSTGTGTFTLASVLKDGTIATSATSTPLNINFDPNWNGASGTAGTVPIKISTRWLAKMINDTYWTTANPTSTSFNAGESWNMKSTNADNQNFTFVGTPNDGEYKITNVSPYKYFVLGNPYPSALDANQFLIDNLDVLNGTIYYYDSSLDDSHYYQDFNGGYATWVIDIPNPPAYTTTASAYQTGGKLPKRYIPVGQGFLMWSNETISVTPEIVFKNTQRAFVTRGTQSEFIAKGDSNKNKSGIPILRLIMEFLIDGNKNYKRTLSVGFREGKTQNFENGYDAYRLDTQPTDFGLKCDDCNGSLLTISTIEAFNNDIEIPLEVKLDKSRTVTFSIEKLENFPETNIYLKDKTTNQYYNISSPNVNVSIDLPQGNYTDRFSVVFKNQSALSVEDNVQEDISAYINNDTKELVVNQHKDKISSIKLHSLLGQEVFSKTKIEDNNNELRYNISKLPTGVYLLKLITKTGKEATKKVLID